jgi:protein involved in polysaccharide export with SLBB domain
VNVLGEVQKPGLYPVDPTVSLAGAVAMAGGTTALGDLHHIRVLREGQVLAAKVAYTRSLQDMDIRSGDQIFVERRGWFDRNSTFVVSALLSLTSIVIALVR